MVTDKNQKLETGSPKKILIVLMGSVGDVVRGLTVAEALKRQNPRHTIGWVVEPASRDLVKLCPSVTTIIVFERTKGIRALLPCIREIRNFRADLVLDLQRHLKSGVFTFCSGASIRIGFNRRDAKEGNFLFQTHTIPASGSSKNKIEQYWDFLRLLNVPTPSDAKVSFSIQQNHKLQHHFEGNPVVTLVLGTRWISKRWPTSGYEELLEKFQKRNIRVLLTGGMQDREIGESLAQRFRCTNLTGATTLAELCFILQSSVLVIGPDSGPAHIAAALGTPHVTLFGPTDPVRTAPYGMEDLVLQSAVPCRGCYRRKCPGLGTLCMRSITPKQVMHTVDLFLKR